MNILFVRQKGMLSLWPGKFSVTFLCLVLLYYS